MSPDTNDGSRNDDSSDLDARMALSAIDLRRRQVIAEIDMPGWYWWGVAICWVILGFMADLGHPWLTITSTFIFGAVHSTWRRGCSPADTAPASSVSAPIWSTATYRRWFSVIWWPWLW